MEDFGDMGVADDDAGAEDSGGYGGYGVEPGNPASADPDGGNTPGPDYSDSYSGPGPGELGAHEGGYPGASGPSGLASDTNPGEYGGESWAERTLEKLVTQLSGKGRLDALQSFGDWMTGFAKEMGLSVSHEDPGAANPDAGQPDGTTGGGEDDDKGEGGEKEETKDDTDTDLPSDAELEGLKQAFETGTGSTNRARELFEKLAGVTGDQARELYQQVAQVDGTEARGLFRQLSQVDDSQARNLFGQIANMDDSEARGFFRQMASIDDSASRGLFEEATGISRAMWDDWDTMGRPTLQAMSDELRDRSTEAYAERAAGLAAADVNQAFDTETENYRRELARYGIDPRSGRATAGLRELALGRAGGIAGAKTRSRIAEEDRLFRDRGIFVNTLDSSGRLASAARAGLADSARGLAGLDAARASRLGAAGHGLAGLDAARTSRLATSASGLSGLDSARASRLSASASGLAGLDEATRRALATSAGGLAGIDSSWRSALSASASGLAGIDASERAAALADLNARRSMDVSLRQLAANERDSKRRLEAAKYSASQQKKSALWGGLGQIAGAAVGSWL